ncbi:M48 family peptidase [Pseudoxanthomonas sp. SGD-10]|uniref:Putative beta-barrel assembly-enhancing protease n=2 Tax=Lysobacteraceae TaxID=32033 RepID=A0A562E0F2_9GAMM|nr:M48 family peptidase [Pseudoxanthomonas sp. SGD-10]TWH15218.1 putative Zn-dependent protease [Pseudoxanthomonas taiwanensis J19]
MPAPRPLAAALLLTLMLAPAGPAPAQDSLRLPDIGSSAGELLTPARQEEYGGMMLRELRNYGYLLDDPLIDDWLQALGDRLGAYSDRPEQRYTLFMLRDRQINAFATLGGYIGVNAGLVLTAEREDEVAAVLAHEMAHVTQQHVLRGVERAQRDQIPILLGMLAAVVAAQAAGGSSSGDASQAAIISAMGLMQQNQINYTRANEHEADRLGIRALARSGYDVDAMADFFARMSFATRGNSGGYSVPEYLRTHPVNTTRIAEAKQRADQMRGRSVTATTTVGEVDGETVSRVERVVAEPPTQPQLPPLLAGRGNPLLPAGLELASLGGSARPSGATGHFEWARERLRALSATTTDAAVREYEALRRASPSGLSPAQRYGLAVVRLSSEPAAVAGELRQLLEEDPQNLWVALALAEAEAQAGRTAEANARLDQLLQRHPGHRAVVLTYAKVLVAQGNEAAGKRAQEVLRPLLARSGNDPVFQRTFARACELAGDSARAGEAYAEAAFLNGRPEQALIQLETLKKRGDLDYVARARIDARIAAITPTVLELRRQGVRDPDMQRR